MADPQITRFAFQVLAEAPDLASASRLSSEVVASEEVGSDSGAEVEITRFALDVLAEVVDLGASLRLTSEVVASEESGADAGAEVDITRFGLEVLGQSPGVAAVRRLTSEVVASEEQAPDAGARVQVTRLGLEVLATKFAALTACDLPDGLEFFAHNWADGLRLTQRYKTSISRGAESIAEERVQLLARPERTLEVRWTEQGLETIHGLLEQLKRSIQEEWAIPLYCDHACIIENASSGATSIKADFGRGRYFVNGNVLIRRFGHRFQTLEYQFNRIDSLFGSTQITLTDPLDFDVEASHAEIIPMMCVIPNLEFSISQHNDDTWDLTLAFVERGGPTALPPIGSGLPSGFNSYREIPILRPWHDYHSPLSITYRREGEIVEVGRGKVVNFRGEFWRQNHAFAMVADRAIGWDYIRFFDTRRGRLRPFWLIEQERLFTLANLTSNFIDVNPLGTFAEFQQDLDFFGFEMKDGTCYVREVINVQVVGGIWRVTTDVALPILDEADVRYAGRAYLTRMLQDSLEERWDHRNAVRLSVPTIRLLEEKDVDLQ